MPRRKNTPETVETVETQAPETEPVQYIKPQNFVQLEAMIQAGYVEVLSEIPPTVQATLDSRWTETGNESDEGDKAARRPQDQRVFRLTEENKFAVLISCLDCGDESRVVRTSDLFQVHRCLGCTAKLRRGRAKARRAEAKAALSSVKKD